MRVTPYIVWFGFILAFVSQVNAQTASPNRLEDVERSIRAGNLEQAQQTFRRLPSRVRATPSARLLEQELGLRRLVGSSTLEIGMSANWTRSQQTQLQRVRAVTGTTARDAVMQARVSALRAVLLDARDRSTQVQAFVALAPTDRDALLWTALDAIANGDRRAALQSLQTRVRQVPNDASAWRDVATCALSLGLGEQAYQAMLHAVQIQPDDTAIALELVGAALATGESERVIEFLLDRVRAQPDESRLREALGLVQLSSGHPTEAVATLQDAVRRTPTAGSSWASLAIALQQTGDLQQAKRAAEQALQLDPDDERAHAVVAALPASP